MYSGWSYIFTLLFTSMCGQTFGYWPFKFKSLQVQASTDAPEIIYPDANAKRIAIIGGGAGGSSAAYHLQQFATKAGISINITVFERNSYIGGRTTTVNAYNSDSQPVELGASIFVEVNEILKNASEKFGLPPKTDSKDVEILGIWNGKEFVYKQKDNGWYYWDLVKLFWKYGLAPYRTQKLMQSTVGNFRKLYEAPFFPFRSLSDRAFDLDLTPVTALTGEQYLSDNNIGAPFATDIIQASTRVNYGQNLNVIHGLETMVCMAIDGAMQIEGGNWQIFDRMVAASDASAILNTTVYEISRSKGRYNVKYLTQHSDGNASSTEPFDTIVLAAPWQFAKINIEKDILKRVPDEIPYVTLHVTLFASNRTINPLFFNITTGAEVPTTVLTTLPPDAKMPANQPEGVGPAGFFSISTLRQVINPETLEIEHLYKIFSPKAIDSEFLSKLLGADVPTDLDSISAKDSPVSWYYPHVWQSYPVELPRITFEDSELARGFYYTSGMESFISTMETMALMGKNVAQLVIDDFQQLKQDHATGDELVLEQMPLVEEVQTGEQIIKEEI